MQLTVVTLLAAANVAVFVVLCLVGGSTSPPTRLLVEAGALIPAVLGAGQYWRLAAAGFLHASPLHLLGNLQLLLVCGPALERRLGATWFALLYGVSLAGGGLFSLLAHPDPFVGVGASGAIFGLLGALLGFWLAGKEVLPVRFVMGNLGLNAVVTLVIPHVDWAAHAGGFVAGLAATVLLGARQRLADNVLRCRFPEFVSANALLLVVAAGLDRWLHPARLLGLGPAVTGAVLWVVGTAALVKLLDVLLSARRGLAGAVGVLALCNGLAAALAARRFVPELFHAPAAAGALACAVTLLLCASPLRRGLRDVGFVPAGLVADRKRPGS